MKMSKRLMAWLLCCVLLMTSANVVWAEQVNAEQTVVGTGVPTAPEADAADAAPTPAPMRMMGGSISPMGEIDPSMNPDPLDPNDPGIPTDYTVTYDVGANTAATAPQAMICPVDTEVPMPTMNDAGGYAFVGWKYINEIVTTLTMPAAPVTLVA